MPQNLVLQIGQCGNQIGNIFWDMALAEHARHNPRGDFNESMSTFFRNVDQRGENVPLYTTTGSGRMVLNSNKIHHLRARGLMIDMEEGVVQYANKTKLLRGLFDPETQQITHSSGCGNNWAVGCYHYGPQFREPILEAIRRQAEWCDSLQSFFICHSMGGGTGSGVGSFVLEMLADQFPDVYRFSTAVFPSAEDDVVTSPYNAILALSKLNEFADCVLPVENQAMLGILDRISRMPNVRRPLDETAGSSLLPRKVATFDRINNMIASMILNMTSSMRFEGELNMDINEISMNLVPFPKMNILMPAISPLYVDKDCNVPVRKIDQMFTDITLKDSQWVSADPKQSAYLASALIVRGKLDMLDIRRNIDRLSKSLRFPSWNMDGWKIGVCSVPPINQPYSLLSLSNNCSVRFMIDEIKKRFMKLYRRKAHLYHYTEHMPESAVADALETVTKLIDNYAAIDRNPLNIET